MTIAELQQIRGCLRAAWRVCPACGQRLGEYSDERDLLDREIERQLALENLVHTLPGYAEHMATLQAGLGIGWTPTLLDLAKAAPRSEPPAIPNGAPGGREVIELNWLATRIGVMMGFWVSRGSVDALRCIEWFMGVLDPRLPAHFASDADLRRQFVAITEHMVRAAQQKKS